MDENSSVKELYAAAVKGGASESVLKFLGDYFEKRREMAGRKICNCEPTLERLLEARSELKEVRRMEQHLLHNVALGNSAWDEIEKHKKLEDKKEAKNG